MPGIEDLLRRREELLREIDREILAGHTRTVTLLFTDIVGSTTYYERMGDIAGRQMVQEHNDLLFPIVERAGGRVVKTIGDSIMASFDEPVAAVNCAVAMQKAIQARNATAVASHPIRVRMGLHWGTAVSDEKDLYGDTVNTAARVESLADGEEILISGELARQVEAAGIATVFLGAETVKGKAERIDIYLVNWRGHDAKQVVTAWRERRDLTAPAPDRAPRSAQRRGVRFLARPDARAELSSLKPLAAHGNPYLNRVMVPHPGMFYGRTALVRRIMGRLSGQSPQSVSIVGERRIGKSSLLNHLRSPGPRLQHLENPESYLFLLADFQQLRTGGAEQFFSLLFGEIRRQHGDSVELDLDDDDAGMRALCEAAAEEGMRLVLLFDEFEAVTRNSHIGPEFFSFLRSLANSYPVGFVTASHRALKEMCASHEISDSPFFNIFSVQPLGLFSREEAIALVREPSAARGVPLEPVTDSIIAMGGLYPFFLQIASCAWFEYLEAEGKGAADFAGMQPPREVSEAFREEARPHFEFVLENLSPAECDAMRCCLAQGAVEQSVPGSRDLERKGYLVKDGDRLVPFSGEFLEFLHGAMR